MLRIKLVKSIFGNNPRNRATVKALGLRKINHVVEHHDTPDVRGMIHHVKHLLAVEEVAGDPVKRPLSRKGVSVKPAAPVVHKAKAAPKVEAPKAEAPKAEAKAEKPKAVKAEKAPVAEAKPKAEKAPKAETEEKPKKAKKAKDNES